MVTILRSGLEFRVRVIEIQGRVTFWVRSGMQLSGTGQTFCISRPADWTTLLGGIECSVTTSATALLPPADKTEIDLICMRETGGGFRY